MTPAQTPVAVTQEDREARLVEALEGIERWTAYGSPEDTIDDLVRDKARAHRLVRDLIAALSHRSEGEG